MYELYMYGRGRGGGSGAVSSGGKVNDHLNIIDEEI
jgi:hypothetical protein